MFSTLGGIFLIIGAYLTSRGDIFKSVGVYVIADFCWIVNAWLLGDIWGIVFIILGVSFGLLAFFRMHKGTYNKRISR